MIFKLFIKLIISYNLFTVFIVFEGILPATYLDHFYLLSSALFKLYKVDASDKEVEESKKEIDLFIELSKRLNYNDKFFKFNTHMLVHLYEDRVKFGPLFYYNAYGYESILNELIKMTTSPNIRLESIIKRIKIKIFFQMRKPKQSIEFSCQDKKVDQKILEAIRLSKGLSSTSELGNYTFYDKARLDGKILGTDLRDGMIYFKNDFLEGFAKVNLTKSFKFLNLFK